MRRKVTWRRAVTPCGSLGHHLGYEAKVGPTGPTGLDEKIRDSFEQGTSFPIGKELPSWVDGWVSRTKISGIEFARN